MSSQRATFSPGAENRPAHHFECRSAIYTSRGMDTKAFAFYSQARYRAGGHFVEKAPASSL